MTWARRKLTLTALKLFDLSLLGICLALATLPVFESGRLSIREFFGMRIKLSDLVVCLAMALLWHLIFISCGAYISQRLSSLRAQIRDILIATSLSTVSVAIWALLLGIEMITLASLLRLWILSAVLSAASRAALRGFLGRVRTHGRNLRHILILGTNGRALDFAAKLRRRPELGYWILGFVDDDWPGAADFVRTGELLCSNFDGLAEYLRRNVVDEVAIYLPLRSFHEHTSQIAALCEQHGVIMRFDSDIFNLKIARSHSEVLEGHPLIITYSGHFEGWPSVLKRFLDVGVSAILLALVSPVLAIVALAVRLDSKGPALFLQERVGRNKRRFMIYKFRTMVRGAERMLPDLEILNEVPGPVFKIKNDPRLTPLGKFLRRTSIDELPQLFNVLRGDMSLVGPRPLPVRDYEGFNEDWQRRRFSVRPGITCLWQISGRSSVTFNRWMELDLQYLDEWSFWLDLKILARTIPAVVKGSGAA